MFEVRLKPLQISYPNHRVYGVTVVFPLTLSSPSLSQKKKRAEAAGHARWSCNPEMDISIYLSLSLDDGELRYLLLKKKKKDLSDFAASQERKCSSLDVVSQNYL